MAGALSTLGLGSQGVLTNDIIDQLKEADSTSIIKPIERKIDVSNTKQTTLSDIKKLVNDLKDQIVTLSEPELYQNKTSTLTGSSITVDASSSAKAQNFDIDVKSLATRDIQESALGFAYDEALVEPQTLTFNIEGTDYDVEVGITDSLKTVAEKIKTATDGKIEASVLNTGGETNSYKLILKSANTGVNSAITVTSTEADATKSLAFNRIGDAPKDAEIEIDGITVTRSNNTVDDLVDGVTLNLQSEGKTSVKVESDNEKLVEEMGLFAEKYNTIIEKLTAVTKYDKENKSAGVFQGTSEIRNITADLNNVISRTITSEGKTIADFGFEVERGGTLKFSETDFKEMLSTDASKVEDFFRGTDGENGLFNKFEDKLFDIVTSSTGALKSLDKNIENNLKALIEEQTKAQTRLDDKYAIMTKRFAAFDGVIAKLSSQSDSIQSMIDAQYADN
jgi:flagellar hook-associated protein 2